MERSIPLCYCLFNTSLRQWHGGNSCVVPVSATFLLFWDSSVAGFPLLGPISATFLLFLGDRVAGFPLLWPIPANFRHFLALLGRQCGGISSAVAYSRHFLALLGRLCGGIPVWRTISAIFRGVEFKNRLEVITRNLYYSMKPCPGMLLPDRVDTLK